MSNPEESDVQAFIDSYEPDTAVEFPNGLRLPLSGVLDAEEDCPVPEGRRHDPLKVANHFASILHQAGNLRPEHERYLP